MIAIVDYGMGNLRSAQKGLEAVGHKALITDNPADISSADAVVLPGVGAFKDCYDGLVSRGLVEPVKDAVASGKPFLGICVGMQLMFDYGEEGEGSPGLGIFSGRVIRFPETDTTGLKVPHMGWNQIEPVEGRDAQLFKHMSDTPFTYFVHSYHVQPEDESIILARCSYGNAFPAVVGRENVYAVQFHPEKSQTEGLALLRAFGELCTVVV